MTKQTKQVELPEEVKELARKYKTLKLLDKPFYQELYKRYLRCKKATGRDPQEWLHKHNRSHKDDNNGVIGWIDALSAIGSVVDAYEARLAQAQQEAVEREREKWEKSIKTIFPETATYLAWKNKEKLYAIPVAKFEEQIEKQADAVKKALQKEQE